MRKMPSASFVVVSTPSDSSERKFAAVTREKAGLGLPGGKVEPGETPVDAVVREATEEGWQVYDVSPHPFFKSEVDGEPVWWYAAAIAYPLDDWKEKSRGIAPVAVTLREIKLSGYCNDLAIASYESYRKNFTPRFELIGSRANGRAHKHSDWDVLVSNLRELPSLNEALELATKAGKMFVDPGYDHELALWKYVFQGISPLVDLFVEVYGGFYRLRVDDLDDPNFHKYPWERLRIDPREYRK